MSLYALIKEKRAERKKLAEQTSEMLITASKEKRAFTPKEEEEWNTRHTTIDSLGTEIERLEKQADLDAHLNAMPEDRRAAGREDVEHRGGDELPEFGGGELTKEQKEKRDRVEKMYFRTWLAGGANALSREQRSIYEAAQQAIQADPELRALSASTSNVGGSTVPQGFQYELETALKWYGGIISAARYVDTDAGNLLPWPTINDTANSGEQIAENSAVAGATGGAAEQDPSYGVVNLSAYMLDSSIVLVPVQLLADGAFNIESYLVDLLKIRMGRKLNALATTGSGSSTLTGVVTASTLGKTGSSPTSISYNEILDLEHSVDPAYRGSDAYGTPLASFMFNDSTLKAVKKLTDSNNRPLWIAGGVSEGVQNRRPDTFDGFGYFINQDMASIGSSAKSMLFGNFKKFIIRRVRELAMFRFGERFMDKLQIGFLAYQRFDSNIVDAGTHPITYFQNSAT